MVIAKRLGTSGRFVRSCYIHRSIINACVGSAKVARIAQSVQSKVLRLPTWSWHFLCSIHPKSILMTGSAWILFGLIVGIVGKLLIPRRDLRFYTDNHSGYCKRVDRWHCRTAVGFLFPGASDGFL